MIYIKKIIGWRPIISVFLALTFIVIGCQSEEGEWKDAKANNSPASYIEFITTYPNSKHAREVYAAIKDTINQMHFKAWELRTQEKINWDDLYDLESRILEINPNDALALNNLGTVIMGKYYDDHDKERWKQAMKLFWKSAEIANRKRIATDVMLHIIEGQAIYFAEPPTDNYKVTPLRDVALENLSKVQMILKVPLETPPEPKDLTITGSLSNQKGTAITGRRIWAIQTGGVSKKDSINISIIYNRFGNIDNPHADTDDQGQFVFNISYKNSILDRLPNKIWFLTEQSKNFDLNGNMLYLMKAGEPVVEDIDEDSYLINLGTCSLKKYQ